MEWKMLDDAAFRPWFTEDLQRFVLGGGSEGEVTRIRQHPPGLHDAVDLVLGRLLFFLLLFRERHLHFGGGATALAGVGFVNNDGELLAAMFAAEFIEDKFFDLYAAAESLAAIIVEPVQGEGGFIVPPKEYLGKLQAICQRHGIVFIVDEIQTGFGRTGKMFAYEHSNVDPDILVTAKSLAAGMPLAGITGKAEIMDSVDNAGIGGTFGGNPVCCQAGLAVLKILEEQKLVERANIIGRKVMKKFRAFAKKYPFIGDVRGLGAMNALEIVLDRKNPKPNGDLAKAIVKRCYDKGLIMLTAGGYGNVIRHLVPLVVTDEQLDKGLGILNEAVAEMAE